jgi:hypothetical protein
MGGKLLLLLLRRMLLLIRLLQLLWQQLAGVLLLLLQWGMSWRYSLVLQLAADNSARLHACMCCHCNWMPHHVSNLLLLGQLLCCACLCCLNAVYSWCTSMVGCARHADRLLLLLLPRAVSQLVQVCNSHTLLITIAVL